MILGWFLYLIIALKIRGEVSSTLGLVSLNSGILRFKKKKKNEFRSSAFSLCYLTVCYSLLMTFFHLILIFQIVVVLKNCLLSSMSLVFRLE